MKISKHLACILLLCQPLLACRTQSKSPPDSGTDETAGVSGSFSHRSTRVLASGDILVSAKDQNGKTIVSYLSTRQAGRQTQAKRFLKMMKASNASPAALAYAESNLPGHPRLEDTDFDFTLVDKDGISHRFSCSSDDGLTLFTLNYQPVGKQR